MKEIVSNKLCTGCTACMNICPNKAIVMKKNKEGFGYPEIDEKKCVDCGLCKNTCPVINTKKKESLNTSFVAYAKEKSIKEKSSSGGIFPLVANKVLDNKGIVIGAAFDKENILRHIAITQKKELEQLKGSKYLQSDLKDIFSFIKKNLKDRQILFVGTPCQVAGLKAFLKDDYENLLCIDLFCHGVPSPALFDKYIKEIESVNNEHVVNYDFRDKSTGWDNYSNTISLKSKKITELQKDNCYMKLFLADVALRESCYNCNFKLGNKYSDITMGDYWGVTKYYPEMYSKDGVSAVIINTEKGENIFEMIKDDLVYKESTLANIVAGNKCLKQSVVKPQKRDEFFNNLSKHKMEELVKQYVPKIPFYKKVVTKIKAIIKKVVRK